MKKQFGILMIIGILFSCSTDDKVEHATLDMRINHYQNTGIGGVGLFLTLMVQEGNDIGSDNWFKFYDTIEGFDYEPGYIYDIKVTVEEVKNPPADASSLKYTLQEIKSTQEVDYKTPFDVDLKIGGQSFITSSDSSYNLLNNTAIDCDMLCDDLDVKLQNEDYVKGTFQRLQTNEIKLIGLD